MATQLLVTALLAPHSISCTLFSGTKKQPTPLHTQTFTFATPAIHRTGIYNLTVLVTAFKTFFQIIGRTQLPVAVGLQDTGLYEHIVPVSPDNEHPPSFSAMLPAGHVCTSFVWHHAGQEQSYMYLFGTRREYLAQCQLLSVLVPFEYATLTSSTRAGLAWSSRHNPAQGQTFLAHLCTNSADRASYVPFAVRQLHEGLFFLAQEQL